MLRTLASVSAARLSASGSARSALARATFSPGTVRNLSPAASSVVSISASAVDSQFWFLSEPQFLKPEDGDGWAGPSRIAFESAFPRNKIPAKPQHKDEKNDHGGDPNTLRLGLCQDRCAPRESL